ncbi:MAG: hypothetical protein J5952_01880 [Prevotella sp.]|nr:hypothetical protein [Prevotella sp.]
MRKIIHRYTVLLLTVLLVGTGIALADTDVVVLGDVNSDGSVNTTDVTVLVNYLHGSGAVDVVAADVNRDGAIDIADVTAINNIISNGTFNKGTASTLFFPAATVNKSYGDATFKNQLVRSGSTGAITYESSAEGVATVNTTTGEVTIQGAGTATITATLADNGGITGTTANYTLNVAQATNLLTTTPVLASTSQDFTGSPVTLVTTEGAALYGSVEYSTTSATEGFSTTVPTATNAGDYTVWYRVPGTASYTAIDAVELGTVTISPATLSVTASDYSGAYDGTAHGITVTCEGATIKYRTTAEGEYNLTVNPTYTNVCDAQTVYYQVTKENYTTVEGSKTVTITQKEVTVSGITASNKTYDGNTTATLDCTGATISGKVESDDLTVTATGTFTDENVGTGKNVTISGITLGGSSAANYKLATSGNQESTTADITAASFTPVVTLSGWTYGSPNSPSVGETNTSGGNVTYYYKTGDAEWTTTQPTDAGTHKVKASIAENGNYAAAESAEVEFTISKATLTATAADADRSYGAANPSFTVNVTGFVNSESANTAEGYIAPTASTDATTESNVGTYDITPSGGSATNYDFTYVKGTLSIAKADITPSVTMSGWTYGEEVSSPSVTGNTGNGSVTYQYKVSSADDNNYSESKPTTPGTYTVKATIAESANYNGSSATVDFTIASGTLAVTASNYSGAYDGVAHGITVTCEGATVKYGEVEGTYDLDVSPTLTNVGTKTVYYQVTKENYTTVEGSKTVTITAVAATVTTAPAAVSDDLTYTGGALTLFTVGSDVTGGTLKYKVTTSSTKPDNTNDFTTTIDQQTNAGTYYLWYYVEGDANHNSTSVNDTGINKAIAKAAGAATLSSSSVNFGTSTANQIVTVSDNTGTVSASVPSGSGCEVSVSENTITITRTSSSPITATITVTIAESTNYNSTTKTINVSGTAVVESATMGSYKCAKIWTSASGGYYVVCTDKSTSATWYAACGYSDSQGGKTFTCGTKGEWDAIMSACGGTGYSCINSKCSSVTGWSNMSGDYWSSTEDSNYDICARFFGDTYWGNGGKDFDGNRVRLVSAF